jgi:hypothetical protein
MTTTVPQLLPIRDLAARHYGITKEIADNYLQAARVCLDKHHTSPQSFTIDNGARLIEAITEWDQTDRRTRNAWANDIDLIENGAYACGIAAVELSENLYTIRRAETRTGADYYVAPQGQNPDDLENSLRLEISGTDMGQSNVIEIRLRQKVQQTRQGNSNLPAIAAVIGFQAKFIKLERVV